MVKTRHTASVQREDAKIGGATGNCLAAGNTFLPKSRRARRARRVIMIVHQRVRMNTHTIPFRERRQQFQEALPTSLVGAAR